MGFKVAIRIRGLTDWINYGYATTSREAYLLVEELEDRVQIVAFPEGQDLRTLENRIRERVIFLNGGEKDEIL